MKKLYFLLVFLGTMATSSEAQIRPFGGSWYASSEVGIFSGRTRRSEERRVGKEC